MSIAGSVERLREIFDSSERKTIFDFDLRCLDEQSKDIINLRIIKSNIATLTLETAQLAADSASKYIDAIDLKLFAKSEDDKEDLKKYLTHLLLSGIRNQFAIVNNFAANMLGVFFQPFGTSFNHSCDPNVHYFLMEKNNIF